MKRLIGLILALLFSQQFVVSQIAEPCFVCDEDNTATGDNSSAFGSMNSAIGVNSAVFGLNSEVRGENSMAFGLGNSAYGDNSFAVGQGNTIGSLFYNGFEYGLTSATIGAENFAEGNYSYIMGLQCYTSEFSFAFGQKALAEGDQSFAYGRNVKTTASGSFVIGTARYASTPLINNYPNSFLIGTNSNLPTFFISDSEGNGKTGSVGIGNVTAPLAKLHILEDLGEDAVLFIEPTSWENGKKARIALGTSSYGISSDNSYGFVFKSSRDYIFKDGKMGVGAFYSNEPEAKLHVKCGMGEEASIFIEPYRDDLDGGEVESSKGFQAFLYLGDKGHSVMADQSYGLVFNSIHDFVFNEGIVAISSTDIEEPATLTLVNNETYYWTLTNSFKGTENTELVFKHNGLEQMRLTDDGQLVIGQDLDTPEGYSLYVEHGILAEKVKVAVHGTSNWMDKVFEDDYDLPSLQEVETFIDKNGHLPGIPSAVQVVEEGVDLLEMNAMLLQKVEELTLYIIEQQKQIDELKKNQH